MAYQGMPYLKNKLAMKQGRVNLRYNYYEMKNRVQDFNIVIPKNWTWLTAVLGWSGMAVDSMADRLVFREFAEDNFNLNQIYDMNSRDVLFDNAVRSACIASCSFIYLSADESGYPRLQVIDAFDATGILDPITMMLSEGYAVLDRDPKTKVPTIEAYFRAEDTWFYEAGKEPYSIQNPAPYPLLVPVILKPGARRPFGHSRLSRACMNIQQAALRTLKRMEISAEFYSFPQKYVLGTSPDADLLDKWKTTISSLLQIDKDEEGDKPTVGQFSQQSMTPFLEQLKAYASLFAGQTGLTLDDLGFAGANPSSYEAIKAAHENLRLAARAAQRSFSVGFLNAGYLAACIRDDYAYQRRQFYLTKARWEPIFEPDASQISGIGDAVNKIQQSFPDYFTEEKLQDLTGF
ncbi:MAG: phage portal protein [Clostridia bacterium]|nr:phage portal protein [Clostridia bacterium]